MSLADEGNDTSATTSRKARAIEILQRGETGELAIAICKVTELLEAIDRDGGGPADPIREMLTKLGDRWTTLTVQLLDAGPLRHSVLRRLIDHIDSDGISQRMLTLTLRALERDGFVQRAVGPQNPPRVDYSLTAAGSEFCALIRSILTWTVAHQARIKAARAAFDATCGND